MSNKKRKLSLNVKRNHLNGKILGRSFDDETIYEVKRTKNYVIFTILEQNRDIDERAVNDLVVSIKKRGQLQPIIVNEDLEVVDGQHRLEACKILGFEVAYLISEGATIKDVILINNTQKSWNYQNYLKTFGHKSHWNHGEYVKLKKYANTYGFNFTICMNLLVGHLQSGSATNPKKSFEAGNFKIKNLDVAEKWGNQLLKIKAFAPQLIRIGKFCMAFIKVQKLDHFSLTLAYEQIEKNVRRFDRCINQEEWDEAMVKAYNYNLRKTNKRISIKKEGF